MFLDSVFFLTINYKGLVILAFYIDEYIHIFWTEFNKCETKEDYIKLLKGVEQMCIEFLQTLRDEELNTFYSDSPFLAMVSEVQLTCPDSVSDVADHSAIFASAISILENYGAEERALLKSMFLGRDDKNVIYMDFNKKKDE